MPSIMTLLESLFQSVLWLSWQGFVLMVLVAVCLSVTRKRLSARWRYLAWSVVVARLLLFWGISSPLSLYNLSRASVTHEQDAKSQNAEEVATVDAYSSGHAESVALEQGSHGTDIVSVDSPSMASAAATAKQDTSTAMSQTIEQLTIGDAASRKCVFESTDLKAWVSAALGVFPVLPAARRNVISEKSSSRIRPCHSRIVWR